MKRGKTKAAKRRAREDDPALAFARGFVATGLLSAFQDRHGPARGRAILRDAVQGGAALAAATLAARALRRRDYATVLSAAALGAGGILAADRLLTPGSIDQSEETGLGQEEKV